MRRVLSECSWLLNRGYLDEIIVVDGTRTEEGEPDFSVLRDVVKDAYHTVGLYHRQVNFARKYATVRETVDRGFFDFVIKAVNQHDGRLESILEACGVKKAVGFDTIPTGKGVGLWLTIPLTRGHVVCFVDSDIPNFSKKFIVALCHPILQTWTKDTPTRMVKAYFTRLTFIPKGSTRIYRLGGRVTRMFMKPYMEVLSTYYPTIFGGLNSVNYPLSGETAFRRGVLENLRYPNDYSAEISSLVQVKEKFGINSMAQVDLGIIHHIGKPSAELTEMVQQLVNRVIIMLRDRGVRMTKEDIDKINQEYAKRVPKVASYDRIFNRLKQRFEGLVRGEVVYSREMEHEISRIIAGALELAYPSEEKAIVLPSWTELRDQVDYFTLRLWMNIWSNWSTRNRLREVKLLK
ncbi:MAG: hypothetical protein ACE5OY_05770 [Candidatus Bathyarchaeia archaeon]